MSRFSQALAGWLGVLFICLLYPAMTPTLVWCHKTDGHSELELEVVPGECSCESCEHQRERTCSDIQGFPSSGLNLTAGHCRHEIIFQTTSRAVVLNQKIPLTISAGIGTPVPLETVLIVPDFPKFTIIFIPPRSADPPGGLFISIRC